MTTSEITGNSLEVRILTLVRRDAEITVEVLNRSGIRAKAVPNLNDLLASLPHVGAILISEEVLGRSNLTLLKHELSLQPKWSDVPVITITFGPDSSMESQERLEALTSFLPNVTLIERPIRLATLITVVKAALASRKKQLELKTILEDLEQSKREAEIANSAKSIFLANMSHEIRTPLAAIIGFSNLMRDQNVPVSERLKFADVIARNGDQLSSLINDILDLSKVEAGKLEISRIPISFPAFFAELSSLIRPMVESKGLRFQVDRQTKMPEVVSADSTKIRQVLLNLVSNAVKFTQEGVVSISLRAEMASNRIANIWFEVSDTGMGMSTADTKRIFKPFSQGDASTTRRFGGTGLGLVLSKAIANAMEGDLVLLDSTFGKGSRFQFHLPVELIAEHKFEAPPQIAVEHPLRGLRILLVEDSPDNQLLMNRYLSRFGASVELADNGRTAVERASKEHFDVVLMDVQMPVLDGLSATRELRSSNYTGPIIALTAHAMSEERDRSLAAGCNDHLTKPINVAQVVATILKLTRRDNLN